jgi:Tol biopolymer transport system component
VNLGFLKVWPQMIGNKKHYWKAFKLLSGAILLLCLVEFVFAQSTIEIVSKDSNGTLGNDFSRLPSVSDDCRYVAFESQASNLVANDTNGQRDIFVFDRETETTERVSVSSSGDEADAGSYNPAISGDGRYVAFQSDATNLVTGDTNGKTDIFLHDRSDHSTTRISIDSLGNQGNGYSNNPYLSYDGRYAVFSSSSNNLVAADGNGKYDVFVRDTQTNTTERVSLKYDGNEIDTYGSQEGGVITDDGRYVVYESDAWDIVLSDTNSKTDIFYMTGIWELLL